MLAHGKSTLTLSSRSKPMPNTSLDLFLPPHAPPMTVTNSTLLTVIFKKTPYTQNLFRLTSPAFYDILVILIPLHNKEQDSNLRRRIKRLKGLGSIDYL